MRKVILSTILLCITAIAAFAQDLTIDGVIYHQTSGTTCAVAGCESSVVELNVPGSVEVGGKTYSVVSVLREAFKDNAVIKSVILPSTLTRIEEDAFKNCTSLESVEAASCTFIGGSAFNGCVKLDYVDISSVTSLTVHVFQDCPCSKVVAPNLTEFDYWTFAPHYGSAFGEGKEYYVGDYAYRYYRDFHGYGVVEGLEITNYAGPKDIEHLEIPSYVETEDGILPVVAISNNDPGIFFDMTCTSVTLPEHLATIGEKAFRNCANLASIDIPNSVTKVNGEAFASCSGLTSITFPKNLKDIGWYVFESCEKLKEVNIPTDSKLNAIGYYLFRGTAIEYIYIPKGVKSFGDRPFEDCSNLREIEFAEDIELEELGRLCNGSDIGLKHITIPASVRILNSLPNVLTSVDFAENSKLETLQRTFDGNGVIESVRLPETVNKIGSETFRNCTSMEFLKLPQSVVTIEGESFVNFGNANTILTILSTDISGFDENAFKDINKGVKIKVPTSMLATWKARFPSLNYIEADAAEIIVNNGEDLELSVNNSQMITASVLPVDALQRVKWSSSDETVAKVDQNGVVTGVSAGSAVITATALDGTNIEGNCNVNVAYVEMTNILYDRETYDLRKGNKYQLKITTVPENASNRNYTISSSDPTVVSVSDENIITAVKRGTATITALSEDGHTTATTTVVVNDFGAALWTIQDENSNGFVSFKDKYTGLYMTNGDWASLCDQPESMKSSEWVIKRADNGEVVTSVEEGVTYRVSSRQSGYKMTIDNTGIRLIPSDWNGWREDVTFVSAGGSDYYIAVNDMLIQQECEMYRNLETYLGNESDDTWEYELKNLASAPRLLSVALKSYKGNELSVSLPSSLTVGVETYPVATIGRELFSCTEELRRIKKVTIPSSIKYIDYHAFADTELQTVEIESGSQLETIGDEAFWNSQITSIDLPATVRAIGTRALGACRQLQNVTIPLSAPVTSIGDYAFWDDNALTTFTLPDAVKSLGREAFVDCDNLQTFILSNNSQLEVLGTYALAHNGKFVGINIPSTLKVIGDFAFEDCPAATFSNESVGSQLQSIGINAFKNTKLADFYVPSTVTSISSNAFNETYALVHFLADEPVALKSTDLLGENAYAVVAKKNLETYQHADMWSAFKSQILSEEDYVQDVTIAALPGESALRNMIGNDNMRNIGRLKISGTINGYDVMELRNQFVALRHLDLSDAQVVANDNGWQYYEGQHVEDNVLNAHSFSSRLLSVSLPATLDRLGNDAFVESRNLTSVVFGNNITEIGANAFNGCPLEQIELPEGLVRIGNGAFWGSHVKNIQFPATLEYIGRNAFQDNYALQQISFQGNPSALKVIDGEAFHYCRNLQNVLLPTRLEEIGDWAFSECAFTEVKIPSSVKHISDYAFQNCSKLMDVYAYVVDPIQINQNTFWNWTKAMLHIPEQTQEKYHYNTQWNQFINQSTFNEDYEYFYLQNNSDVTLKEEFTGTPDVDLNNGSGLVAGEDVEQKLGDVTIKVDPEQPIASIIGNFTAKNAFVELSVQGGRWYFLSFPFPININKIECEGQFVVRHYNGELRAKGGSGWEALAGTELEMGHGYILQCENTCTIKIPMTNPNFFKNSETVDLKTYVAENAQNASWNLLGNPFASYMSINSLGIDVPITVWNGSGYETVRPEDDEYYLKPFEAYFIQKPNGKDGVIFAAEFSETYLQTENGRKMAKAKAVMVNPERLLVNLELTNGEKTDKTRIAFSEKHTADYEIGEDAAKFMANGIPQLYSIEDNVMYSINERPMGDVNLGFKAPKAGEYSISASRMDTPMLLKDNLLDVTIDLSNGAYSFSSNEGTFGKRFTLVADKSVTSIADLYAQTGISVSANENGISIDGASGNTNTFVYTMGGVLVKKTAGNGLISLKSGGYIVKVNGIAVKTLVK